MSAEPTAAELWEARYAEKPQVWSGKPNAALVKVVADWPAGRALDLGSGEGGDALWLAEHGWTVHAIDISPTAIHRGRAQSEKIKVADQISWQIADLTQWKPVGEFDLVAATYLHSQWEMDRATILRKALSVVAPGGALLIIGHADFPPWSNAHEHDHEPLPTNADVIDQLVLSASFTIEIDENRARLAIGPDGQSVELTDSILLIRRAANVI